MTATETACIFALRSPASGFLHVRSVALWQDGQPGPVPYASVQEACEAAKRNGWTLTRLPAEEGVPEGWADLYESEWASVERLMARR